MSAFIDCACPNVPRCMIEWGINGYALYHPGTKLEFFIPYQILAESVSQQNIEEVWRSFLHDVFCANPPTFGREIKEEDLLKNAFSLLGSWVHLFKIREDCPEGKAKYQFCRIIRLLRPRD